MRYQELDTYWKRIFDLEWISLCEGSKAIAALIVSDDGTIISEGRNKIGEKGIPNPRVSHAEVEAIRNLDINKYPYVKSYTLYTALEPCPMCMGTMVMGGIRNIVIGAKDAHGGAMHLIEHSEFLRNKNINITWMPQEYGDVQRGFQALKELLYNTDKERCDRMMDDFSVFNKKGVIAAKELIFGGLFNDKSPASYRAEEIFDKLMLIIER
ncbi:MAG: nucleoside deaminase [Lachnospiraceae bacterium]|nr:nucleoside deaminase [Lachnospiraceae bacterium]